MKKTIILIGLMILLPLVIAFDYSITENQGNWNHTLIEYDDFSKEYMSYNNWCRNKQSETILKEVTICEDEFYGNETIEVCNIKTIEELVEYECIRNDYDVYIDTEVNKHIQDFIDYKEEEQVKESEIQDESYESEEADNWFMKWVKWFFNLLRADVEDLENENQKIKDCSKDSKDFSEYQICVGGI